MPGDRSVAVMRRSGCLDLSSVVIMPAPLPLSRTCLGWVSLVVLLILVLLEKGSIESTTSMSSVHGPRVIVHKYAIQAVVLSTL